MAFNYGGRAEIVDAARSFQGESEDDFREHLYAPDMHDPDLLIRTSGEQRISNYLLWQCAYSEFVFRDELWPDFAREAFEAVAGGVPQPPAPVRRALGPRMSSDLASARILGGHPGRDRVRDRSIVTQGGEVFARGLILLGCSRCDELYSLMRRARPDRPRRAT